MQKVNDPAVRHTGSGALIRRFLPYLAKYKKILFIDLFCAAMTTLCDIILPKIMSTITNSAMGVGITLTAGIVLKLAAVYFVLRIIDGAAQYFMSGIGHIMGVHIETDMRRDAFDHLLKLDHTYYNNTKVGTIMGRITNDLFDVTEFAHHCPEEFFIAGIKILASFLILCQASVPLTLAVFACVPLMGVVSVYLNGRLRARFRQQRVQIGELNSTIEDSLLGQGVVKAFAAEDEEREKFAKGNKDFEHIKTLGYYAMAAFNTSTRLFDGLMYLVVILAGYTREMETFLTANSGLASRFPNKIEFPDYTADELLDITNVLARGKGYRLAESCTEPLRGYYERRQAEDARTAGNGRLARNTLEKAIFNQSRRLVAEPAAELDVILPGDLELQ
jgi:ATP-binding cassette subfamily B protein